MAKSSLYETILEALELKREAKQKRVFKYMPKEFKKRSSLEGTLMKELKRKSSPRKLKEVNTIARKKLFLAFWEKIKNRLEKVKDLDKEKLILNTSTRNILSEYLDRFEKLAGQSPEKASKELSQLLESLDYLLKVISEIGKKKKG